MYYGMSFTMIEEITIQFDKRYKIPINEFMSTEECKKI